ncbi:hypothetical protein T10_4089 [Trichinella papuae]|uniref:Uncharacterized protein n=1 Tax=Trichinella papuae TaxID=268474 RepID=A0A0V1M5A1_9BILA|nr:hypothetical protein T10_4089 [Trichinella papuae]
MPAQIDVSTPLNEDICSDSEPTILSYAKDTDNHGELIHFAIKHKALNIRKLTIEEKPKFDK